MLAKGKTKVRMGQLWVGGKGGAHSQGKKATGNLQESSEEMIWTRSKGR